MNSKKRELGLRVEIMHLKFEILNIRTIGNVPKTYSIVYPQMLGHLARMIGQKLPVKFDTSCGKLGGWSQVLDAITNEENVCEKILVQMIY